MCNKSEEFYAYLQLSTSARRDFFGIVHSSQSFWHQPFRLWLDSGVKAMKKKKTQPFNAAFQDLQMKIYSRTPPERPAVPSSFENRRNDLSSFVEAMSSVTPLPEGKRRNIRNEGNHPRPSHPPPDDEKEAMDHLRDLIRGSVEMDFSFTDEYIEGCVKGLSRKTMKKLKRGELPVQDFIDLHGFTKQEAEVELKAFLIRSYKLGFRCVLIVHGRGLNSPESLPVIKEGLPRWLGQGPIRKLVLAFATARPYDGGTGAIYVLLRRR
jgi:DNA-nicking Smr family endonuclease